MKTLVVELKAELESVKLAAIEGRMDMVTASMLVIEIQSAMIKLLEESSNEQKQAA
jgi:hypothetical protein